METLNPVDNLLNEVNPITEGIVDNTTTDDTSTDNDIAAEITTSTINDANIVSTTTIGFGSFEQVDHTTPKLDNSTASVAAAAAAMVLEAAVTDDTAEDALPVANDNNDRTTIDDTSNPLLNLSIDKIDIFDDKNSLVNEVVFHSTNSNEDDQENDNDKKDSNKTTTTTSVKKQKQSFLQNFNNYFTKLNANTTKKDNEVTSSRSIAIETKTSSKSTDDDELATKMMIDMSSTPKSDGTTSTADAEADTELAVVVCGDIERNVSFDTGNHSDDSHPSSTFKRLIANPLSACSSLYNKSNDTNNNNNNSNKRACRKKCITVLALIGLIIGIAVMIVVVVLYNNHDTTNTSKSSEVVVETIPPTFQPTTTHFPSNFPSMVPSYGPTITEQPSVVPSSSPTTTTSPTDSVQVTTFYAVGDVPYAPNQLVTLRQQMAAISDDAEFVIHVGDMRFAKNGLKCIEQDYTSVSDALKLSRAPVFIIMGDNDWVDCANPDDGLKFWNQEFLHFTSRYWDHKFNIVTQPGRSANFAFVHKQTLFLGLNIIGGVVKNRTEWNERLDSESIWTLGIIREFVETTRTGSGIGTISGTNEFTGMPDISRFSSNISTNASSTNATETNTSSTSATETNTTSLSTVSNTAITNDTAVESRHADQRRQAIGKRLQETNSDGAATSNSTSPESSSAVDTNSTNTTDTSETLSAVDTNSTNTTDSGINDSGSAQGDVVEAPRIVIFGHAQPYHEHAKFFDPLVAYIRDEIGNSIPILYLNGDKHRWEHNTNFFGQKSLLRIMVNAKAEDPPLQVQVHANGFYDEVTSAFQYNRML